MRFSGIGRTLRTVATGTVTLVALGIYLVVLIWCKSVRSMLQAANADCVEKQFRLMKIVETERTSSADKSSNLQQFKSIHEEAQDLHAREMGTVQDQLWRFQGLLKEADKQRKSRNEAEQRYQSLQLQYESEKESRTKAETVSKEEMQARVTMEKLYEGEKQARLNDKLDSNMRAPLLPAKVE